ncbi:MAG: cytochrome C [Marinobacter sp.]
MRSLVCLLAASLSLASPSGEARDIPPRPGQVPAPGNHEAQTPVHLAGYAPSVNYKLQCMGCHLEHGEGIPVRDVPMMTGFVGNYLKVEGGREFLIQVPGASLSGLSNQQLAELLNWMLKPGGIAAGSTPTDFEAYTEEEVKNYRSVMIGDIRKHRQNLIDQIKALDIAIPERVMP